MERKISWEDFFCTKGDGVSCESELLQNTLESFCIIAPHRHSKNLTEKVQFKALMLTAFSELQSHSVTCIYYLAISEEPIAYFILILGCFFH